MVKGWMRAIRIEDQGDHCLLQEQEGILVRMVSWPKEDVLSWELHIAGEGGGDNRTKEDRQECIPCVEAT